jgi:hypothetical protein
MTAGQPKIVSQPPLTPADGRRSVEVRLSDAQPEHPHSSRDQRGSGTQSHAQHSGRHLCVSQPSPLPRTHRFDPLIELLATGLERLVAHSGPSGIEPLDLSADLSVYDDAMPDQGKQPC